VEKGIRIATVYKKDYFEVFGSYGMNTVRWTRISESLANRGFKVDMIITSNDALCPTRPNLHRVPFSKVIWKNYPVIKTLYHTGYQALVEEGVERHPFVISRLGSVVGSSDDVPGVHFFKDERRKLYEVQLQIHEGSKYVAFLSSPDKLLWEKQFGQKDGLLLVPTGVDRIIPDPSENPYAEFHEKIAVYIGNIRKSVHQMELNLLWQEKLNALGSVLKKKGIRLCFIGLGDTEKIDSSVVTYLGPVRNDRIWDYQYFADVGITLAMGEVQNHESSKIYYYLRTGLPVVSEEPIPNNYVIEESNLGFISHYQDNQMMADMIETAIFHKWDHQGAIRYILNSHTWDERARIYEQAIRGECEAQWG
jgi:hypothetical protein